MKEQNNKNNKDKDYVESFKEHLISLSKSQNTVRNYVSDVTKYFEIFDEINRENVLEYKKKISGFSTTTINCKLSSLKSFNAYLLSKDLIEDMFIIKSDFIKKQDKGNPTTISEKQVSKFLDRVDNKESMYHSRNVAIIYLIANTGIRREEITNLKLKGLNLKNKELIVLGKYNKERTVYLNRSAVNVLKDYLQDRQKHKFANSPYLFLSERKEKLHKDSINYIFNTFCTSGCKVKPHGLRHNYASTIIEHNSMPLHQLQNQLGHSSVATTGIYLHPRKDSIKKNIDKLQIGNRY